MRKFKAAAENELSKKEVNTTNRIRNIIIDGLKNEHPFQIGSFPNATYSFRYNFVSESSGEKVEIGSDYDFFRQHVYLSEMASIQVAHKKLQRNYKKWLNITLVFLLYSLALFGLAYKWQLAGYPTLFVDFLAAHGLTETRIEEVTLALALFLGAVMPAIGFVRMYLCAGFKTTLVTAAVLCVFMLYNLADVTSMDGYIAQHYAQQIYLGYFGLIVLVWFIYFMRSLRNMLSFAARKKGLVRGFLDTMEQDGRIVYGFIRLVTLWYQHERDTDGIPMAVADLAKEYDAFFAEAQKLDKR
jgi:hypothetical protein